MPNGSSRGVITGSNIGFQPSSRLYVNQGERSYKFIRAENIPPETRRSVQPGERVDFVAYFERIEPGYTVFDLFECRDTRNTVCFNFWGVHIINPKKKDTYAQRTPRTPAPVQPKPQTPQPKYTPRTSPGLGSPGVDSPSVDSPDESPSEPAPKPAAPTALAIRGVTRNAKTKKPIVATVTYRLLSGAESAGDEPADSVRSVSPAGNYKIDIDKRGVYAVTASAKGYFTQRDTLATNRIDVARNFDLVPIEAGEKITLKNIYFAVSKYDLEPESFPELDRLVTLMQENPTMTYPAGRAYRYGG